MSLLHGFIYFFDQIRIRVKIRKPLPQVDGAVIGRKLAHHRKYRGADAQHAAASLHIFLLSLIFLDSGSRGRYSEYSLFSRTFWRSRTSVLIVFECEVLCFAFI